MFSIVHDVPTSVILGGQWHDQKRQKFLGKKEVCSRPTKIGSQWPVKNKGGQED